MVVLLGLVIAAAVLAIAGFGAAIGAGLLLGVILGVAAVAGAMAFGRRGGVPGVAWSSASGEPDDEAALLRRFGESSARVADVDSGDLTAVLAIGREVDAAGIRVELLTVELRTHGGIATLAAHSRPPVGPPGHFAEVSVRDELGTEYVAAGQATGSLTPSTSRLDVRFAPAPSGTTLTIDIEQFLDPFSGGRRIEGPWTFSVSIPRGRGETTTR